MAGKKGKVLVVDDAIFMRRLLADILNEGGYEIAGEGANGKEGVEQYKKVKPDIVTMDIIMPEMGGIDAVKEIMKFDSGAKILVVSAMGQQAMIVDAIQAGAKGFVIKPFKAEVLLEEVKRIIG